MTFLSEGAAKVRCRKNRVFFHRWRLSLGKNNGFFIGEIITFDLGSCFFKHAILYLNSGKPTGEPRGLAYESTLVLLISLYVVCEEIAHTIKG